MTLDLSTDLRLQRMGADVRAGLTASPKTLPPKYFYDTRGSELFDEITRLPEYYPTRTETAILTARSGRIAGLTRTETLVELGSGLSAKTRLLIDAMRRVGTLRRFVPVDVDSGVLAVAASQLARDFPGLQVDPVVGDFEHDLRFPMGGIRTVAFLGSTIGNLEPAARARFLRSVRNALGAGEWFLLGTDLVKTSDRLVRAYDDAGGVTAEFNKNVLRVLNRDLGADFDLGTFDHVARWNDEDEWIEMRLRSRRDQVVTIPALDLRVSFAAGEDIRTEISAKFRPDGVLRELRAAGFEAREFWTDTAGDFALTLAGPSGRPARNCGPPP